MPPRLNIPPITRILLIVLLSQSTLSAAIRYRQWTKESDVVVPYLTLVPQLSVIYPWVFLTAALVESNVFTLGITGVTIYYGGRYLERAWGSTEFLKFLLVVSLIPNIISFAVLVILFAMTADMSWTLTTIAGGISLQISFLIAFSQLVPAHTVTLFRGIVSMRVPRFPVLYVLFVTVLTFTPLLTVGSCLLATFGFLVSWTYLRFYKAVFPDLDTSQPSRLRGDASETFALSEFFPEPLRPAIVAFSNVVYNVLVSAHICMPFSAADVSASRGESFAQRSTPGSTRAETERRRALALKALDQRLHDASAGAARPAAKSPQPASTAATDIMTQPKPSTQTAMTSQPSSMLGETSYVPDPENGGHQSGN